jgi:hypothetical protein
MKMMDLPPGVTELDKLAQDWREQKEIETRAAKARVEIENKMLELIEVPDEGSSVTKTAFFKCNATGKLTRKLDVDVWDAVKQDIPEPLWPVRTKTELDLKKLRSLEQANPEIFKTVARAISSKKAKTSIKVEVLA